MCEIARYNQLILLLKLLHLHVFLIFLFVLGKHQLQKITTLLALVPINGNTISGIVWLSTHFRNSTYLTLVSTVLFPLTEKVDPDPRRTVSGLSTADLLIPDYPVKPKVKTN